MRASGFLPVSEEWPSCYFHHDLKLYLVIYVDDFKLAGPTCNLKRGWSLLQKGLTIEAPTPVGVYLGCGHEVGQIKTVGGTTAQTVTYNMEDFLTSCVERYLELAGPGTKMKHVATPFLPDDQNLSLCRKPLVEGPSIECPWCNHTFARASAKAGNVKHSAYPACAGGSPRGTATACNNNQPISSSVGKNISPNDCSPWGTVGVESVAGPGQSLDTATCVAASHKTGGSLPPVGTDVGCLQPIAAKVLMKIIYAARLARFDLLRAVCHLATFVTKWTSECDRKLHRLVCYINSSKHLRMIGWVGDGLTVVQPHLYADADFAGCVATQRSTSGYHFAIRGPHTCFPIAGVSKRQGCVSHSTPEAEMVAADFSLRHCGLPCLALWWNLLPSKPILQFHEDNQAMIRVVETGRNPTMRYLQRTHGVSVAWLHEIFKNKELDLSYELSARMCADIYTKAFTDATLWVQVCYLINVVDPNRLPGLMQHVAEVVAGIDVVSIKPTKSPDSDTGPPRGTSSTNEYDHLSEPSWN